MKTYSDLKEASVYYEKEEYDRVIKAVLRLNSNAGVCDELTLNFPELPAFVTDESIVEWDKFEERLSETKVVKVWVFKQNQLFHVSIHFHDRKIVLISCKDIPELHEQFK
jgi:hypothetical protein